MGQSLEIFLPDSSKVILEPGSELRLDEKSYAQSARTLELDGSALFDVMRNENSPFTIKTSRTEVRVLGTSFLVSDRKSSDTASVTVITGKVRFSVLKGDKHHKDLTPGEKGFITKSDLSIQSSTTAVDELQYELNKTIIFKGNLS
ncbi:MAG: FecR domain-containing protein [Bacteroidia bacterium]